MTWNGSATWRACGSTLSYAFRYGPDMTRHRPADPLEPIGWLCEEPRHGAICRSTRHYVDQLAASHADDRGAPNLGSPPAFPPEQRLVHAHSLDCPYPIGVCLQQGFAPSADLRCSPYATHNQVLRQPHRQGDPADPPGRSPTSPPGKSTTPVAELSMLGHLGSLVPGQRLPELLGSVVIDNAIAFRTAWAPWPARAGLRLPRGADDLHRVALELIRELPSRSFPSQ